MRRMIPLQALRTYLLLLFIFSITTSIQAQYFGRNKVNYKELNFKVLQTPNFEIYHNLNDVERRNRLAQQTEQWYRMHQVIFKDTFRQLNPFLMYSNHADFQQTRAIQGQIGVGTGGVTEALKNRVIMPFMESNAQTDHVLGHELVHAFQYHIIQEKLSLSAIGNIPLWMVEGLAEYMSIGPVDAHTAIWLRNGVASNKLPTLKDLTNKPNEFFPYRWGQAFWAYTTGVYGDSAIRPLFLETGRVGYEQAVKNVLKIDAKTFSERWQAAIRNAYAAYQNNTQAPPGKQLIYKRNAGELNIVPSISPDGKRVAFWTEKNVFSIELFVADAETGENVRKVTSNNFGSHIDEYSSFESSVAWSPDSRQVAFVAFAKGRNSLIIANADNGRKAREITIPGVPAFSNPTWSPDGNTIVVTGLMDGQSDLYAYNLRTNTVRQLTNDRYADLQPSFSPDGRWIVFATDRRSIGNTPVQHVFSHNLALLNMETGAVTNLDFFNGANNLNPVFGADNNIIYFLSDRDGFRNMYSFNITTREIIKRTNLYTGITGITMYSPAISAAKKADRIVYTHYSGDNYTIFSASAANLVNIAAGENEVNMLAATLPPFTRTGTDIVAKNLANTPFPLEPATAFTEVPYRPKFELDYIGSTGVGMATGRFGTGLAGGVNGIFSDILGNNQLFGGVSLNGELYDVAGQFAYINQKKRLNWGAAVSHIPYLSGGESFFLDTITLKDRNNNSFDTAVVNYSIDLLRTFEDQVQLFASYPFSQIRRIEGGGSFARYYYRMDRYSDYYTFLNPNNPATYQYVGNDRSKLDVPRGFSLGQVYMAFVGDNSNFGLTAPLTGHRFRFEAAQYMGAINLTNVTGDYRRYFRLSPVTLATRNMYLGRFGTDASSGRLPPLYVGYPSLVRGYDARTFTTQNTNSSNQSLGINDLIGSQMYVGNVELRLPLTGPERLASIKSRFLFSDLNLFTDGGIAWGAYRGLITDDKGRRLPGSSRFIASSGLSLRVNLFGYLIIEPYYAIPWQNGGFSNANFGLNFIPGW